MSLLDEFERFRHAIAIDDAPLAAIGLASDDPDAEAAASVDLATLVAEWNALRHEIKQQNKASLQESRAITSTLESIRELRASIEDAQRAQSTGERSGAMPRERVLSLLPAIDALDFAIGHWEAALAEHRATRRPWLGARHYDALGAALASGAEGSRTTRERFIRWLGDTGVVRIETIGRSFDTADMMAVGRELTRDPGRVGIVASERLAGYRHGNDLLRPADVVVFVAVGTTIESGE